MALAIVFRPKLFGQLSSYFLSYPIPRATNGNGKSRTQSEAVELDAVELKKGVAFIEPEVWQSALAHGRNAMVIEAMRQKGAISVYVPDAEEVVGSTTDFTDLSIVSDILRNTVDAEWISRSISRDPRKEVFKMGSDRIKEIKEDADYRRQSSLSMELV